MKIPYSWQEKEIDVLGSRFIAIMVPLDRFDDIDSVLRKIEEKYPKATHYPYAARLTPYEKASDDGEPAHSTGVPILSLMQMKGIDHLLLCVVRYFGGTKLGLSRLTRTYREAASLLINEGVFAEEIAIMSYSIYASYSDFEGIKRKIKDSQIEMKNTTFGISVSFSLLGDAKIIDGVLDNFPNTEIKERKTEIIRRRIEND